MKLIELEINKYENFVKTNKYKSHFLQSSAWGEFSREKKNLTPYYVGLIDDNEEILGAALLLKKSLPLGYSYFYSPRGFVLDFNNKEILETMTKEVVKFTKTKKSIFLKIDPDLIYKKYDYKDEEILPNYNPDDLLNNIKSLGFKHLGFTKNFETMQPRYTFRVDLTQDLNVIESHFSKTTMQRVNKAKKLNTKVEIGSISDIDDFYNLMLITESRKDFVSYDKEYYKKLYEILTKENMVTLFLGKVNLKEILDTLNSTKVDLEENLNSLPKENLSKNNKNKLNELTKRLESTNKDITKYEDYLKEYGETITLNAHMIVNYNDKAWVLYAGNHNILTETNSNYNVYYEHLKYCKEKGIKIYDQFGTIGDLSKNNPRLGLHEFKKKFGGDYVEFIGEFDYVTNKFMYFVFTKLVPLYRKIIRNKSKRKVEDNVSRIK